MGITGASLADPRQLAADIVMAHVEDRRWLDAFVQAVDESRNGQTLSRVLAVWGLSQTDAAAAFGVTRQAISKWLDAGAPSERAVAIADLSAATDVLVRHITRERIPAVVRRPAAKLGDRSLLDLLAASGPRAVLDACQAMFAFESAHA
jgi:hypothetical protein